MFRICSHQENIMNIEQIREAVADALEARGHGNREFLRSIREGRQDSGPFMIGALAVGQVTD